MRRIVLVNGAPASGKSTVVDRLRRHLPVANVFEMDAIKEAFMDVFGAFGGEDSLRLSRAASAAIWRLIGTSSTDSLSIVDCWIQESEREELLMALEASGADRVVEVWCHAEPSTVVERYVERVPRRHPGHLGAEFAPQLRRIIATASPVGVGELVRIDTERDDLDVAALRVADLVNTESAP